MRVPLTSWMLGEAISYALAALIHAGIVMDGYENTGARIAESLIALALAFGWLIARVRSQWLRPAALWAQGLALFWTMVGVLTIVLGVGPRTIPDIIYHAAIVAALIYGLTVARQPLRSHERIRHLRVPT